MTGLTAMSALGQKQTSEHDWTMSALPPKADMVQQDGDVRFVPKADIRGNYSITKSARAISVGGTVRPSALAVLRLIASSYLSGNSTGISPGFSPLRIRAA